MEKAVRKQTAPRRTQSSPNQNPSLQSRKKLPHPFQPAIQLRLGSRIRNPDVFPRPESLPGHGSHVRFSQQASRHVRRRLHPAASQKRRNIRIRIERSFRQSASHSRNRTQSLHHVVAQFNIFPPHFRDALLRTIQRRHRRFLHNRSR